MATCDHHWTTTGENPARKCDLCDESYFDWAERTITEQAAEIRNLRATVAAIPDGQEYSVTLTAPNEAYVYMPKPGRLKVRAVLPVEAQPDDMGAERVRDAVEPMGYRVVSLEGTETVGEILGVITGEKGGE